MGYSFSFHENILHIITVGVFLHFDKLYVSYEYFKKITK